MSPATKPKVKHSGKAVVERCEECDACQEWLLMPSTSPACTRLMVMMPDGEIASYGTERKVFRAIEAWFKAHAEPGSIDVGTIEWRHGTCRAPVLRKPLGWRVKP